MTTSEVLLALSVTVWIAQISGRLITKRRKVGALRTPVVPISEPLQLYPRDIIVIEIPGQISHMQACAINDHFGTVLPGYKVIVLSEGMKMSVLRGWLNQIDMVKDRLTGGITH
jgi:hypothetical protein